MNLPKSVRNVRRNISNMEQLSNIVFTSLQLIIIIITFRLNPYKLCHIDLADIQKTILLVASYVIIMFLVIRGLGFAKILLNSH